MKTIITTGAPYADIDALASAYAFKDLLKAKNIDSEIVFSGPINSSVPKSVFDWGVNVRKDLPQDNLNFNFVIVDVSDKNKFPAFVDENRISEIYDHRFGYQDQWIGKNIKVKIEEVGACATLIWEEIKSNGLVDSITELAAKLVYTAIFSNTLNFNAGVTTDRDKKAFEEVQRICGLSSDWVEKYYQETEKEILMNPREAIINDTKPMEIRPNDKKMAIGQMELWNGKRFISENQDLVKDVLNGFVPNNWFMTVPSISEGKNYLFTESDEIKNILSKIIDAKFDGDIGITNKLWLRKEILKKLLG